MRVAPFWLRRRRSAGRLYWPYPSSVQPSKHLAAPCYIVAVPKGIEGVKVWLCQRWACEMILDNYYDCRQCAAWKRFGTPLKHDIENDYSPKV